MTSGFVAPPGWDGWVGPSGDPNDEQFGDLVEATAFADVDDYDAALVGEPFDGGVIGRRGAREGPRALRANLAGVKTHHFGAGPVESVGDLGDVAALHEHAGRSAGEGRADESGIERVGDEGSERVADEDGVERARDDGRGSVRDVQRRVRATTARLHDRDVLPVFLGGDNSLTYPNAAPLLDRGSLGAINLDAHLDVREVRDDATSGTPYRQLFEAGLEACACLGARHFETSTAYAEYLRERGGEVVTAAAVGDDREAAVERALAAVAGVDAVYVSIDLDVLDAAFAPGVSAPTPGGLAPRELFDLLGRLAGDDRLADRLAGFEVVECAPRLDEPGRGGAAGSGADGGASRRRGRDDEPAGGRTAAAGARAVAHFIAGHQRANR
jgi:formimidoylglutamase